MTNNPEMLEREKILADYKKKQAQVHAKIQELLPRYEEMFGKRFPNEFYHSDPEGMATHLMDCLKSGEPADEFPEGYLT